MKTKKILQLLASYVFIVVYFIFLTPFDPRNPGYAMVFGVTFLVNVFSILQTRIITKAIETNERNTSLINPPYKRVFQMAMQQQIVLFFLVFISIAAMSWIWNESFPLSKKIFGSLFYGALILYFIIYIVRQKLVLSESGIIYFTELGKIDLPWENVLAINKSGFRGANFLIVRDVVLTGLWERKISEYEIPISIFDENWRTGEIGKTILQEAHLEFIDK